MSRVGQLPIEIPKDVTVTIKPGNDVTVKGPKGELHRTVPVDMTINLEDNRITVTRPTDQKNHKALHGLTRSLIANMVEGVSKGFDRNLEVVGVGYRVQAAANKLVLQVGFTHPVEVIPPPGISLAAEGTNKIKVSGIDKELVGETAAKIRRIRPPDAYKGKGVRYAGEYVRLKPGKAGRAGGKKK